MWSQFLTFTIFVYTVLIDFGQSLKCYECSSDTNPQCGEIWNSKINNIQPRDCSYIIGDSKYCFKKSPVSGGQFITRRGCSGPDVGAGCEYVKIQNKTYQTCTLTCQTDLCNLAYAKSHPINLFTMILLYIFLSFQYLLI